MTTVVTVQDYERHAKEFSEKPIFEYFGEGTGHEDTLRNNIESYKKYRIRPRYLRNVENRTIDRTILGKKVSIPIGLSPTAFQKIAHKDGELAAARAAQKCNTIYVLSTFSTSTFAEVAEAAPHARKWFQTFIFKERQITQNLVKEAEKKGFEAIVLTVDFPVLGMRVNILKHGNPLRHDLTTAIIQKYIDNGMIIDKENLSDPAADWNCLKWLKTVTKLPIIAKGILTAEDAILAVEVGVSAILVSNHGARQLDGIPSTIEALPEIVKAVGDQVEIYIDGGIRDGTDVYKTIALGARMVFIGRPLVWGLSHSGEEGVVNVLKVLGTQLDKAVAISGCSNLDEVTNDKIVHESFYSKI